MNQGRNVLKITEQEQTENQINRRYRTTLLNQVLENPDHKRSLRGRSRNLACHAGSSLSQTNPLFIYNFFAGSLSTATWTYKSVMPERKIKIIKFGHFWLRKVQSKLSCRNQGLLNHKVKNRVMEDREQLCLVNSSYPYQNKDQDLDIRVAFAYI